MSERTIEALLEELRKESGFEAVRDTEYELGVDADGDEAVWLWLIIDDAYWRDDSDEEHRQALEGLASMGHRVLQAFLKRDLPWVYVRFRSVSEQKAEKERVRA